MTTTKATKTDTKVATFLVGSLVTLEYAFVIVGAYASR
jgi:hypothetical protein